MGLVTWWKRSLAKKDIRLAGPRNMDQLLVETQELGIEPHTATTFQSLANELIQEIIRLVPYPQTSLSLCSKRLHILTESILYANVSLTHQKSYPFFIRTISCRPNLTNYVRHFHTSAYTADWDFDLDFLKDKIWIRRSLPSIFGESACHHWFREIFAFRPQYRMLMAAAWDAITAFLLCLFSGLQSIDMKPYGLLVAKYSHIDMVLERVSMDTIIVDPMGRSLLSNLRSVSIEGPRAPRALTINFLLPFLKVKSVSRIRVSHLSDRIITDFGLPSVLETADLALLDSHLSPRYIQKIIPLFNSLKRFQYQYGVTERQHHHLLPATSIIKESLLNSRNSLEQLMISDDRHGRHESWITTHSAAIGSLRDFSRLRVIKADAVVLLGEEHRTSAEDSGVIFELCRSFTLDQCFNFVQSLPTSLEHLTIWRSTTAIVNCLEYMFPLDGNVLPPHFKSLTLFFRNQVAVPSDSEIEEWAERASKVGVTLKWERTSKGLPIDQ
ncbi:hypothetical protein N431DRAFT_543938 [Stipitochalara longipes BDJ]|nr:hypothetical protein N431DRAFT_543938 [Stipitochalara longipes BDJ]